MKTYYAPATVEEALNIYHAGRPGTACWLAGGTDLKLTVHPSYQIVIDLKKIADLRTITKNGNFLILGGLTTVRMIEKSEELFTGYPTIMDAARQFGSLQIRERATVAGNICFGSPAADLGTALLGLDAVLCWRKVNSVFEESLAEYYQQEKALRTQNHAGLILEKILIPRSAASPQGAYLKIGRRKALETSIVSAAVSLYGKNGRIEKAGIALGAVASSPLRAYQAEALLTDCAVNDQERIAAAGRAAAAECSPITDINASSEYRRAMVEVLVNRGITQSVEQGEI